MPPKFGIIRDLSMRFVIFKEKMNKRYNNNNDIINEINPNSERSLNLISSHNNIELPDYNYIPKYIQTYEKCNDLLKEFDIEFNKLKEEQQKQIIPTFDETETKLISQNIQIISQKMTEKLQKCKNLTKDLNTMLVSSNIDENIKINMYQNLLNRLAETSKSLQTNEEKYLKKYQEINGNEINNTIMNSIDHNSFETTQTNFNSNSNNNCAGGFNNLKARNQNLEDILNTVNELHSIFEDVANLIIYQGTILDRIDYNIYETRYNIRRGNRQLEEAEDSLKNGCLRKMNLILIIAILIMGIIILFKYFL